MKTLPGIREAIEQREWELVPEQMEKLADALTRVNGALDEATEMLRRLGVPVTDE